jgi:hypothetical protein
MARYLPIPPRAWSRVQNACNYADSTDALLLEQQIRKGNVLQYKGNSSRLTKSQVYSKMARGTWTNRTKVFATQGQTYSNPNTTDMWRVGATEAFSEATTTTNPTDCKYLDGGQLVCGSLANPCTNQLIHRPIVNPIVCYPASCSDVPTETLLCWDARIQPWFPKTRRTMNNSGNKWPVNYKAFVSALSPLAPLLSAESGTDTTNSVLLSWTDMTNACIPISEYRIYQDGVFIQSVPFSTLEYEVTNLLEGTYAFYVVALSTTISSLPSNIVQVQVVV